ncbi:MAG: hypothetical protein AAGC78_19525 [Cellvibrio sp.]|uniref:hypothetical protein n=1 Tax=Cellvibrio sp. TaxID=1965322 RepID=UPI0031B509B0
MKAKLAALALSLIAIPHESIANDCTYWQKQINKVNSWSRNGGNANQQKDWQRQQQYLQNQLAKCNGTTSGPISIAKGQASNSNNYVSAVRITSNINDSELQQLIANCNRWVDIYNSNPTFENQSTKDTVCRTATNKESQLKNPKQTSEINIKRSIKECIKPNNVVDKDVKECMQGLKEPTWLPAKN